MSEAAETLSPEELREAWPILSPEDRLEGLRLLSRDCAEDLFFELPSAEQAAVVLGLPPAERRSWVRLLPPDDAADMIQAAPPEDREALLQLLDETTKREVSALLAYEEDRAGGLMHPRFARLRPDMTVEEAITYLRAQPRQSLATLYYAYVLDQEQHLLGVVAVHELLAA
ncbi:MAG TPA: magnesium transporter, partial [Myxococcales bacterium]|nr:magnesium transporter [Myxococcales bacterium]